ncbi:unnamed protein product [Linum tenue]|uniref:Uncharacterized protein n=1 Tax=Linum tenue TaxID=586396 RepID=A0AAV0PDJ0_9ROSI|nr:unnamed protein product [Linum tenue]
MGRYAISKLGQDWFGNAQTKDATELRIQTLPYHLVNLAVPLPGRQLLRQANSGILQLLHATLHPVDDPQPRRLRSPDFRPSQQRIPPGRNRPDLGPKQHGEVVRQGNPYIHLAHVQNPTVAPHEHVIVAQREGEPGGGGVALDDGDGRHREGDQLGDDGAERVDHVVEPLGGLGSGPGGSGPAQIEAVGEESALGCGDEDRAPGGLGFGFAEG